jgi:hypothetical protein
MFFRGAPLKLSIRGALLNVLNRDAPGGALPAG